MAEIKVGEVALVKTTSEPCFVLEIEDVEPAFGGFTKRAVVRLPRESKANGITHDLVSFYVEELESRDDRDKRQFDEFLNLTKQSQSSPVVMDTEKMGVRN